MIIVRSPLRITLGGGGTDLPSYYQENTGFLIAAAIDKYVYITLHQTFYRSLIVKYAKMEKVDRVEDLEHPIVREALKAFAIEDPHLEITSMADIPAGTGLGSSGSFTTALLKALHTSKKSIVQPSELAEQACDIEMNRLQEPIGKQDQYIAAYGGVNCFTFHPSGAVDVTPLKISEATLLDLEEHLLLFYTGQTRSASQILKHQNDQSKAKNPDMLANLHFIKELAYQSQAALEKGDLVEFSRLLNVHWERKQGRSQEMTNSAINRYYQAGMASGALGGKLIGAGGGGFLMFCAEDKSRLRRAMAAEGLKEVRFRFDFRGTTILA